ncbi:MAG: GNAT family N-acetyltransferase [Sphingomonadales bacterium]
MELQPTLSTDRLILRPIGMRDWEAYAAMWLDPRVTAFIGGSPRPREVAWPKFGQAAAMWSLFGYGNWSVIDRADDTYMGVCGFAVYERGIPELEGFPEAGWAFAAASWGRGVASEAIAAIHHWADAAGHGQTRCLIDDGNIASIRVAERVGYVPFATIPGERRVFRRQAPSKG